MSETTPEAVAEQAFADPNFPSMGQICGAAHPTEEGIVCEVPLDRCFVTHQAQRFDATKVPMLEDLAWPNPKPLPPRPSKTGNHKAAMDMADRVHLDEPRGDGEGIPADAARQWNQEEWVDQTRIALRTFLADRVEPFTTPEHFWPLIDAPREMRALSVVVQYALKQGWMEEDGGVRLRGDYASRDGAPFKINKIVPVYRSLIAGPRAATG